MLLIWFSACWVNNINSHKCALFSGCATVLRLPQGFSLLLIYSPCYYGSTEATFIPCTILKLTKNNDWRRTRPTTLKYCVTVRARTASPSAFVKTAHMQIQSCHKCTFARNSRTVKHTQSRRDAHVPTCTQTHLKAMKQNVSLSHEHRRHWTRLQPNMKEVIQCGRVI